MMGSEIVRKNYCRLGQDQIPEDLVSMGARLQKNNHFVTTAGNE